MKAHSSAAFLASPHTNNNSPSSTLKSKNWAVSSVPKTRSSALLKTITPTGRRNWSSSGTSSKDSSLNYQKRRASSKPDANHYWPKLINSEINHYIYHKKIQHSNFKISKNRPSSITSFLDSSKKLWFNCSKTSYIGNFKNTPPKSSARVWRHYHSNWKRIFSTSGYLNSPHLFLAYPTSNFNGKISRTKISLVITNKNMHSSSTIMQLFSRNSSNCKSLKTLLKLLRRLWMTWTYKCACSRKNARTLNWGIAKIRIKLPTRMKQSFLTRTSFTRWNPLSRNTLEK